MDKSIWIMAIGLLISITALGQRDTLAEKYSATITQEDLRVHLTILASDEYEGREAGKKGQKMAAEYLKKEFSLFGIPPLAGLTEGYYQPFDLRTSEPGGITLKIDGREYLYKKDLIFFKRGLQENLVVNEVVFVGYGNTADYGSMDVSGKVVLAMSGGVDLGEIDKKGPFTEMGLKAEAAKAANAAMLMLVSDQLDDIAEQYSHYLSSPRMRLDDGKSEAKESELQTMLVSQELAADLMDNGKLKPKSVTKKLRKGKKLSESISCDLEAIYNPNDGKLSSENVLGYIEGSDKKDELVVVTAHYDHIGVDGEEVYNGADDDGSGTVALLEMAQAFAQAKADGNGPRRSILFMPVSAEEKGLLGSEYYSDHPVFPLANTVADLNIDMIGRVDEPHADSDPYVYIIGSDRLSSDLHVINDRVNETYVGLDLDMTFNAHDDPNRFYFRSDHYNFAKKGIPVIFYFSGVHEDYHQPGDEIEKIRFDLLEQRTKLVFHTAWELVNREERIVVDKPIEEDQ